jgi:hypothetical protein
MLDKRIIFGTDGGGQAFQDGVMGIDRIGVQGKDCFTLSPNGFHSFDGIDVHFRVVDDELASAFLFYLVHIGVLGRHRFRDHLFDYVLHGAVSPGTVIRGGAYRQPLARPVIKYIYRDYRPGSPRAEISLPDNWRHAVI